MTHRLAGGVQREFTTLAWIADLLLQGRIAEATDATIQRMKSIELVSKGESWQASQKLELAPPGEATMTQRSEKQIAQREQKLDRDVKGGSSYPSDKGKSKGKDKWSDKGGERSQKGKGKQKEGEGKKTAAA